MAFTLDFSVCSTKNCENLQFNDTSTNWADASIAIGDSVYVIISMVDSNSITEAYDVSAVFDAATVQSDLVYNSEDYNGGPFSDGKYTITYSIYDVSGGTLLYTKEKIIYLYCSLECCIENTKKNLKDYINCNNCDTAYILNYFKMRAIYEGFKLAVAFGNITQADEDYATLLDMCDFKNCNCN